MSNVIDMNKYKSVKDVDTEGDYLQITIGESTGRDVIILVEQVEVVGTTTHTGKLVLDVNMLHRLIEELISAADIINEGDFT
tara:strand:+ start:118 stop:363 length:246 start_codon:yes stop_codon:yes gene_type:complete